MFRPYAVLAALESRLRSHPQAAAPLTRYRFGDVEIDLEKLQATRQGKPLDLTAREYDILRLLIRCRGEVVTRNRLLNDVWGYEAYPTTRTADNHILMLRKELEDDPAAPRYVLSIYGQGYKFLG